MGRWRRSLRFLDRSACGRARLSAGSLLVAVGAVSVLAWRLVGAIEPTPVPGPEPPVVPRLRDMAADVEPPTTDVPRESCVTAECHPSAKDRRFVHGPLHVNACDSCHALTDPRTHTYEPARPEEQLCVFCHELDIPEDSMVHEPLETGECLPCHDPHGGSGPNLLRAVHYVDMCTSCHEDLIGARNHIHGPASAGACGACHEPHASKNRMLLTADGTEMCLRCHVTTGLEIEMMGVVHGPVQEDCQFCHDPHATEDVALLIDEPAVLCVSCHEDIGHTIETAATQHGAITTERACLSCHAAHASDHPRLLENDVMALCFECHNEEIEGEDGTRLVNMKAIIETGTSLHGAIAARNCVACHEIHGGGYRRLLVNEYPSALYYPFDESGYALCFSCHDKALVTQEQTSIVTAFRNGETNLHYVHVNRDRKGRTCRVCHDSHAADREQHIHDSIPFGPGGWKLPIRFERVDDGGRCAASCHANLVYSRSNPVDYPPRPNGEDWTGEDMVPGARAEPRAGTDPDRTGKDR